MFTLGYPVWLLSQATLLVIFFFSESVVCFYLGDAVPKLSSTDVSSDEPRLLLYLNKEISTSLQTGEKEWLNLFLLNKTKLLHVSYLRFLPFRF